jgi:hypothetical protein
MLLTDLRIYSSFSRGRFAIPEIVDLYGSKGFGAIAITDTLCEPDTMLGRAAVYMNRTLTPAVFPIYMEILRSEAERAWNVYRMLLIPGFEITKPSMMDRRAERIVALGVTDYIGAEGEVADIATQIRAKGGLAVAAATASMWARRHELAKSIDAWEAVYGGEIDETVVASRLPVIATSGMRSRSDLHSWKTAFFCKKESAAIFDAVRRQDLCFMRYNGGIPNDIRDWVDLDGNLGLHNGPYAVRNLSLQPALPRLEDEGATLWRSLGGLSRRRLAAVVSRIHSKTPQRDGLRA